MSGLSVQVSLPGRNADNYLSALRAAGCGSCAGVNPAPDPACAGLLLCGGGDVDPGFYGQENRGSGPPDRARDAAEIALVKHFLSRRRPILAICRGMQLVNIALGGTLIQDLPRPQRSLHTAAHGDQEHALRILPESELGRLYGDRLLVNSSHHQAVDRLGEGLRAVAWSPDGVIEAVEHEALPILGVQFHPERMRAQFPLSGGDALFGWFAARLA